MRLTGIAVTPTLEASMRTVLLSLSMALLLACGGSNKDGPSLSSEAAEVFESIKDSYRARKFRKSATALDAFLKENPEHSIGWILLRKFTARNGAEHVFRRKPTKKQSPWTLSDLKPFGAWCPRPP